MLVQPPKTGLAKAKSFGKASKQGLKVVIEIYGEGH